MPTLTDPARIGRYDVQPDPHRPPSAYTWRCTTCHRHPWTADTADRVLFELARHEHRCHRHQEHP